MRHTLRPMRRQHGSNISVSVLCGEPRFAIGSVAGRHTSKLTSAAKLLNEIQALMLTGSGDISGEAKPEEAVDEGYS